ncbi:MAG TPA: TIGR04219 family outer membrane beta-barrel protein [Nitrospirota bacterium]
MRKTHLYATCLAVLVLIAVPCSAFAFFGVEAGVGVWHQTPSGTISYKPLTGTSADVDLKNDMNLGSENQLFVRAKVELPLILPNVYFMATPMSFKGNGALNRDISFNNIQFNATAFVESKVKLDHYDLAFYYPIPLLKTATLGKLNVDLGLDVRQIAFEGTITGGGQTASKSMTVYLPMIYAGVQFKPISLIGIEGEVRGISYGSNTYIDYIARVKVNPIPLFFVGAGYRAETVKLDIQSVKADIKFSGPFAEVGLSF